MIEKLADDAPVGNVNATVNVICPPAALYVVGSGATVAVWADARAIVSAAKSTSRKFFMGNRMAEVDGDLRWAKLRGLAMERNFCANNATKTRRGEALRAKEIKKTVRGRGNWKNEKTDRKAGFHVCQRVLWNKA